MRFATKKDGDDCRDRKARRTLRCVAMRDDAGQSLVELALILPVFVLLILGAVEFGQLAYAAIEVSNAARAGVQYGAQSAATAADAAGMVAAARNDGSNVYQTYGLTVTPTTFCSCSNAAAVPVQGGCPAAATTCSANGARVLNYVEVNTSATITPLIHYPGFGGFTLTGLAVMRVE
jgi:Flp pilus assembly protein TadG